MKKIVALLMSAIMIIAVLTACGSQTAATDVQPSEAPSEEGGIIGVIPKSTLYDYWKYVRMGAEKAAKDNGYTVLYQGTATDTDVEGQVKIIEDFITKGVKAIVISPVDESALVPALQKADEAGIPVVIIDGSLNADFPYATISTDDKAAGALAAEKMLGLLDGNSGKIAVVSYVAGSIQGDNRVKGFVDAINADGKCEVLNTYYSDGDRAKAFSITQDILTSNPDIKGIYSTNEGASVGVLLAIEAEKANDVVIIGFDTSTEQIDAIKSGLCNGLIAQNPLSIGYQGVDSAIKVLSGQEVEKNVAVETLYVDSESINSEDVQTLLTPPEG